MDDNLPAAAAAAVGAAPDAAAAGAPAAPPAGPGAASADGVASSSALARYKTGMLQQQRLLEELLQETAKEKEELKQERLRLQAERQAFEEEANRVQHLLTDTEQVVLNVGGVKHSTTMTTLRNAPSPSLFNAMFSGRHVLKMDDSGCFFIDRDGRHFHDILNFLRDGTFNYPLEGTDYKYLLELRTEANFYGLTGLVNLIDRYPYGIMRANRAVTPLNVEEGSTWCYEDGQDEVVFTVDRACQLLGVGLCGTEGSFTAELEVYEVEAEDFGNEVSTLQSAAQTFTKADGQLVKLMLPGPAHLQPGKFYMISALIRGSESFCSEDCLDAVVVGGVKIRFHSWESPNGTNELRGQFPELYMRVVP